MTIEQPDRLSIDRAALAAAVNERIPGRENEWCVACGASSSMGPELPRILEQRMAQNPELLDRLLQPAFVQGLAEKLNGPGGEAAWCVACGESKGAGPELPEEIFANRASLPDAAIRELAARYLIKTG